MLDWFNEWATSYEKLEQELGTDIHVDGGGHRVLLLDAISSADPQSCLDILSDILQMRLPAAKAAPAPVAKAAAPAAAPAAAAPLRKERRSMVFCFVF